jgi:hypothetical protein
MILWLGSFVHTGQI